MSERLDRAPGWRDAGQASGIGLPGGGVLTTSTGLTDFAGEGWAIGARAGATGAPGGFTAFISPSVFLTNRSSTPAWRYMSSKLNGSLLRDAIFCLQEQGMSCLWTVAVARLKRISPDLQLGRASTERRTPADGLQLLRLDACSRVRRERRRMRADT